MCGQLIDVFVVVCFCVVGERDVTSLGFEDEVVLELLKSFMASDLSLRRKRIRHSKRRSMCVCLFFLGCVCFFLRVFVLSLVFVGVCVFMCFYWVFLFVCVV